MKGTAKIRMIDSKFLVPRKQDLYEDVGLLSLIDKLAWGPNTVFRGPKGAGKTLALEQWAAIHNVPLIRQDCTSDTTTRDLLGSYSMEGDEVFFALGVLTNAIEIANELGGCIAVLEELNSLEPGVQKVLNPIADYRQEISMPKLGRVFRVNPDCRIWMVGTMNPNYGGTYNLNEDLRSRWEFVEVGYMDTGKERNLLTEVFTQGAKSPPSAGERNMINKLLNLAKETRGNNDMQYALSTRDLVSFIENFLRLDCREELALKMLEGKYEGENIKNFRARVKSAFNVDLTIAKLY